MIDEIILQLMFNSSSIRFENLLTLKLCFEHFVELACFFVGNLSVFYCIAIKFKLYYSIILHYFCFAIFSNLALLRGIVGLGKKIKDYQKTHLRNNSLEHSLSRCFEFFCWFIRRDARVDIYEMLVLDVVDWY